MPRRPPPLKVHISPETEDKIADYFSRSERFNSLSDTVAYLIDLGYRRAMALQKYAPKANEKKRKEYTPIPIALQKCGRCRKPGHRRDECPKLLRK